ncbi:oligosaccharide flippase family protein, partial [Pseudomonadota bacterium]
AVIQSQFLDDAYKHTAWNLNWLRGVVLAIVCYFAAPYVALFFQREELEGLIKLAGLIPLLRGFESLGIVLLKRELNFRPQAYVELVREVVNTTVAITLVLYWQPTAEAIVWGMIAGTALAMIASYFAHPYTPVLHFDAVSAGKIWRFGGHLLGAGALVFAMTNLDNVVIGKMVGMEQLGYYTVAFTLAGVLTTQLVQLMNQVLFPAMSRIRDDGERMVRIMERSLRGVANILTPVVFFLSLFSEPVVRILFGEQWLSAVPVLMVLLLMGWVRGIATVFGPVLLAFGRVAALHGMKWKEFVLFGAGIVPAVHYYGIIGAAFVLLLVYLLSLFLHIRLVLEEQPGSLRTIIRHVLLGTIPGLISAVVSHGFSLLMDISNIVIAALFVLTWGLLVYIREQDFILQFWEMRKGEEKQV